MAMKAAAAVNISGMYFRGSALLLNTMTAANANAMTVPINATNQATENPIAGRQEYCGHFSD